MSVRDAWEKPMHRSRSAVIEPGSRTREDGALHELFDSASEGKISLKRRHAEPCGRRDVSARGLPGDTEARRNSRHGIRAGV